MSSWEHIFTLKSMQITWYYYDGDIITFNFVVNPLNQNKYMFVQMDLFDYLSNWPCIGKKAPNPSNKSRLRPSELNLLSKRKERKTWSI